jgi:hypothetical protein
MLTRVFVFWFARIAVAVAFTSHGFTFAPQ